MDNPMLKVKIAFEGKFQMWTYDVSHGRLLLRRQKRNQAQTRIDIVFTDVRALEICTFFDSIAIEELDDNAAIGRLGGTTQASEHGLKQYLINSKDWHGYIVAGNVFWHEDDGHFADPSVIYKPGNLMKRLGEKGYFPEG